MCLLWRGLQPLHLGDPSTGSRKLGGLINRIEDLSCEREALEHMSRMSRLVPARAWGSSAL